jgi:uncharacterized membrane protein
MGIMSGVYFTFSTFIMRSLDVLPAATAIEAMNAINRVILRSAFMPLFFGSTLLALVLVVTGLVYPESRAGYDGIAAGMIYFGGMFVCTVMRNVPLNDCLVDHVQGSDDAEQAWKDYRTDWTRWNHVRSISSLVAMAILIA